MFKKLYLHILLFCVTLITTTLSGAEWIFGKSFYFHHDTMGWNEFFQGFLFSIPFLCFLTLHEFGHYFMAKIKKIDVTLPYFIPAWFVVFTSIGTFGAFIKIKDRIKTREDYFDIGIAGPIAGFIVALLVLSYGLYNLPTADYVYMIHPEYLNFDGDYRLYLDKAKSQGEALTLGKSLIFSFLEKNLANPSNIPHPFEMTHYPLIVAGFLGLLFTAINLLPIGQLDGGHILYALIGKKAFDIVSPLILVIFVGYSGLGLFKISEFQFTYEESSGKLLLNFALFVYFNYLCFSRIFSNKVNNFILALGVILIQLLFSEFLPEFNGYSGFLAFGFLIGRFLGVYHPETEDIKPLGRWRTFFGWISILIFILCFSPNPIN